jgi:hypothetical protein
MDTTDIILSDNDLLTLKEIINLFFKIEIQHLFRPNE